MRGTDFSEPRTVSIAVLGAGALGCLYGGMLAQAGCRVSLISRRKNHREAINSQGLRLMGPGSAQSNSPHGGELITCVRAYPDLQSAPPPDLLLVAVKSHETEKYLEQAAAQIPPHCLVLTLQNGIGNIEAICKHVPQGRVLAGVSYRGAANVGPGAVRHTGKADTVIGAPLSSSEYPGKIRQLFERAGMPCSTTQNLPGLIWTKLMVNLAINPLSALTRLTNGPVTAQTETISVMSAVIDEAMAVARAREISLETDDPLELALRVGAATSQNKASMLQDVLSGRKTEIRAMNGAIVKAGKELGLATPVNEVVTNLVLMLEKSYLN